MKRAIAAFFVSLVLLGAGQVIPLDSEMQGTPATPVSWEPQHWAVDANNSDMWNSSGLNMDAMEAHHGPACEAPLARHTADSLAEASFQCNNHIMTAMSAGYGAVYLTPPAMMDFTNGESVLRFSMTTHRTVGRDWVDIWVTPFGEQFALPLNLWLPPYQGEPRRAIQVKMEGSSHFEAYQFTPTRRSTGAQLPQALSAPYETWLTTSPTRRDVFELRLSQNHISFCMPDYNKCWINTSMPALDWTVGVVQIGHHAYNPTKDCSGDCANTWHWSNVSIEPSVPLDIIPTSPRWAVARKNGPDTLTLQRPAPANATARFAAVGTNIDLSFDNGATWTRANRMPADRDAPEHFSNYLVPVPQGATTVKIRATGDRYIGVWMVSNFNVMAGGELSPPGEPTPTPTPAPPTPTPTPTSTPTPVPSGQVTVTFNDLANPNRVLNGQYPTGVADWQTNKWYLSGPYGQFTTNSVSFNGSSMTSATVILPTARTLVSVEAYNGGSATTVTLACDGLNPVSVPLAAGARQTITTGWTQTCAVVTVTSTNGWDTNFDNFVLA